MSFVIYRILAEILNIILIYDIRILSIQTTPFHDKHF